MFAQNDYRLIENGAHVFHAPNFIMNATKVPQEPNDYFVPKPDEVVTIFRAQERKGNHA